MPRQQRPLDGTGPVTRFAKRLRDARSAAGLTLRQLETSSGYARSTLSLAEGGSRLPAWEVVEAYVGACGRRDLGRWRGWWDAAEEDGRPPAPQQLPADVPGFAGRTDALTILDKHLAEGTPVVTVSGPAGVGKTSLAVRWGHARDARFPDGRVYLSLRGFTGDEPMPPAEALRGLLDALGVPPAQVPADVGAQTARFRSLVAGKRLLVILDNARDAAQVRPLLPGSPGVFTLVTSRNHLAGLTATDGAEPLELSLLPAEDGRALLAARVPEGDPAVLDRVVARCDGLPLALSIVAARARQRGFSLGALADELADHALDTLTAGDAATDIRTVFSWSYAALSAPAARLFRLLGLTTGPDVPVPVSAALAGVTVAGARGLLAELGGAGLVIEHEPGRHELHDLLRAYGREMAEPEARDALRRMLDHLAGAAVAADRRVRPKRDPMPLTPVAVEAGEFRDRDEAMAWLTTERAVLLAAVRQAAATGFDAHAYQLVWALNSWLRRRGSWPDYTEAWHLARASAERLGQPAAQAMAERGLANVESISGRPAAALRGLERARALYREAGDLAGEAQTLQQIAATHSEADRHAEALEHAHRALALFTEAGHPGGAAAALNGIGWCLTHLGRHEEAVTFCRRAVAAHRELGDQVTEALALDSLALALLGLGRHDEAIDHYRQSVALHLEIGDRVTAALIKSGLGDALAAAGDTAGAEQTWRSAYETLADLDHPQAGSIADRLRR